MGCVHWRCASAQLVALWPAGAFLAPERAPGPCGQWLWPWWPSLRRMPLQLLWDGGSSGRGAVNGRGKEPVGGCTRAQRGCVGLVKGVQQSRHPGALVCWGAGAASRPRTRRSRCGAAPNLQRSCCLLLVHHSHSVSSSGVHYCLVLTGTRLWRTGSNKASPAPT